MSYSKALQKAVLDRLKAVTAVTDQVGTRIYDNPPVDVIYPFISLGASDYVPEDYDGLNMRNEALQIDIWGRHQGALSPTRAIADAVKAALHDHWADLETGALNTMRVTAVRVFTDLDGITAHGVVTLEAAIEEV